MIQNLDAPLSIGYSILFLTSLLILELILNHLAIFLYYKRKVRKNNNKKKSFWFKLFFLNYKEIMDKKIYIMNIIIKIVILLLIIMCVIHCIIFNIITTFIYFKLGDLLFITLGVQGVFYLIATKNNINED